jgi:hypothetical protein
MMGWELKLNQAEKKAYLSLRREGEGFRVALETDEANWVIDWSDPKHWE